MAVYFDPKGYGEERMSNRPATIVLCADDYALAPGVSRVILELLETARLSATSCMTVDPFWREHGPWLRPLRGRVDIGLHLTLTDQPALTGRSPLAPEGRLPPLRSLLARALTHRLGAAAIDAELVAQLDAFESVWGAPPDFLDGHQHVHQLPVIRDSVIALWQRRLARHGSYIRLCDEPPGRILRRRPAPGKALVISLLARRFARRVRALGIPANRGFAGVDGFAPEPPFAELMPRFLAGLGEGALVMCHPGEVDRALIARDPLTRRRAEERAYLASDAFSELLARRGFVLGRLPCGPAGRGRDA